MAKTMKRHIEKGLCEEKEYKLINRIVGKGQIRFIAKCPFCDNVREFVASVELGHGVKCDCGAMFFKRRCYFYHYHNNKLKRKTPDDVHHLSIQIRCPKRSGYSPINIQHCLECEFKREIILEMGMVECKFKRGKK